MSDHGVEEGHGPADAGGQRALLRPALLLAPEPLSRSERIGEDDTVPGYTGDSMAWDRNR